MPHDITETDLEGWLNALSLTSLDQWDVLAFLSRHHATLLGVCALARCLGYPPQAVLAALNGLESLGLVERSRAAHRVRLYQVHVPFAPPQDHAWTQLLALASSRAGRVRLTTRFRGSDPTTASAPGPT